MDERRSETLRRTSLAGSVVATIAASVCCIGPLIALLFGVSGFAAAGFFAKWRPFLLAVTFSLLGMVWVLTYRRRAVGCDGDECNSKGSERWKRAILWVTSFVVIAAAAFPSMVGNLENAPGASIAPTDEEVLRVKIPSMDCAGCAVSIHKALKAEAGIRQAEVSFDKKEAIVSFDGKTISRENVIATINKTGFKAEPINEGKGP